MKISVNLLGWIVAALLGFVVFLIQTCEKPCPEPPICPVFDTAAFIKTLPIKYKDTTIYKPVIVYKDTGSTIYVEVPVFKDSLEILMAYLARWESHDTIINDSNALIVVNDIGFKNKIQQRWISPKIIYPHYKIVTKTITLKEEPRNIFMLGAGVTGNEHSVGFSIGAGLLNKKRQIFIGSYDLVRKEFQIQYYLPVRFSRR